MKFEVTAFRYSKETHRLHFTASGERDDVALTVVAAVPCTCEPRTRESVDAAVLLKLTKIFDRPSASGK